MKKDLTHELVDRAREMRNEPTAEESKLWHLYLKNLEPRFIRQKIIGFYIVDFYCPRMKLIIEIDGEQHYLEENAVYEKRREEYLKTQGCKILRFYNSDINKSLKDTETTIYYSCVERAKELGADISVELSEE